MKQLILDQWTRLYEQTERRPDARLFARGELVRFPEREGNVPAGAVLRVDRLDVPGHRIGLRRRSGEVLAWSPTPSVEVFVPSTSAVKVGMVVEWSADHAELGARAGDLGRVADVHPSRGVTVRSHKVEEARFDLEEGVWHYAVTKEGMVGHLRDAGDLRLEAYRDIDPAPDSRTDARTFDELARPYSLVTHGSPPPLEVFDRGDLVYFAGSRAIPENHAFTVRDVREGRIRLVDGRELSAEASVTKDVWWQPRPKEEVRLYKPGVSIASQDLVVWKRDDPQLLVRKGTYSEVLEVRSADVVVAGVTSTPEVLAVDRKRWSARWHRENETWHLERSSARERVRAEERTVASMTFSHA